MKNRRLEWNEPCPACGDQMEYFNDEDNGAFGGFCQLCGHEDPRDYYKDSEGVQHLISKKEALTKGYIFNCPQCGDIMYPNEKEETGKCIICSSND